MSFLRVVRLQRSGAGMFSQLAMCIPISDGRVRIVKVDYDAICSAATLTTAGVFHVDVNSMQSKAHVMAAVEDDIIALRALLPEYEEVRGMTCACLASCRVFVIQRMSPLCLAEV